MKLLIFIFYSVMIVGAAVAGSLIIPDPLMTLIYWPGKIYLGLPRGALVFGAGAGIDLLGVECWRFLFERRYICPVCHNTQEKLNQLDYWRGHGAHIWHPGA